MCDKYRCNEMTGLQFKEFLQKTLIKFLLYIHLFLVIFNLKILYVMTTIYRIILLKKKRITIFLI